MLLRTRRRRKNGESTTRPSHLARKLLAQLIAESIGVYLLKTAPLVIAQMRELHAAVEARVNTGNGGPRRTKAQKERMERERRERMKPDRACRKPRTRRRRRIQSVAQGDIPNGAE